MSPMQAIVAATARAAECLERPDIGTLEAGKRADVLVVDGDPLADITVLQKRDNVRLVMKDGRAFPVPDKAIRSP
jgi:imidazolonepropionase-like amidohydrolase